MNLYAVRTPIGIDFYTSTSTPRIAQTKTRVPFFKEVYIPRNPYYGSGFFEEVSTNVQIKTNSVVKGRLYYHRPLKGVPKTTVYVLRDGPFCFSPELLRLPKFYEVTPLGKEATAYIMKLRRSFRLTQKRAIIARGVTRRG